VSAPHFFLCYVPEDLAWAEWIAWVLRGRYSVHFDHTDDVPGSNKAVTLDRAVEHAHRTIALLSESFFQSDGARAIAVAALLRDPGSTERRLVPIRVRACTPRGPIASVKSIDLFDLPEESSARERLSEGIAAALGGREKPGHQAFFPARPEEKPRYPGPAGHAAEVRFPAAAGATHSSPEPLHGPPGVAGGQANPPPRLTSRPADPPEQQQGVTSPRVVNAALHTAAVYGLAFSPSRPLLASASLDHTIALWDVGDLHRPSRLSPFPGPLVRHDHQVLAVAFSPDGDVLASGGTDKKVRLWDVSQPLQPRQLADPLPAGEHWVWSVAFSGDGQLLAAGDARGKVFLWDIDDDRLHPKPFSGPLEGHREDIRTVAFSPDSRTLASADGIGTVRLWGVRGDRAASLASVLEDDGRMATSATFVLDGPLVLLAAARNKTVVLRDVSDPYDARWVGGPLPAHTDTITAVRSTSDGLRLATADDGGTIMLWDVSAPARRVLQPRLCIRTPVSALAWSPAGRALAAADEKGTVWLWPVPGDTSAA
jgi:hypothetical protein